MELDKVGLGLCLFELCVGNGVSKSFDVVELLKNRVDVADAAEVVNAAFIQVLGVELGVLFELQICELLVGKGQIINGARG